MTAQSHSQSSRDIRLAARQGLLPARGSGWMAGFNNMLSKELGEWFRTRRWLWQLLLWVAILNGFIVFLLFAVPALAPIMPDLKMAAEQAFAGLPPEVGSVMMFFGTLYLTGTLGVIILAQDEVIQEKQSGTAAWILSKPASRPAFILTKLISNLVGMMVLIVAVPALVLLGEIFLATHKLTPILPFMAGAGVIMLMLVFYISLVILLGVLFESRGRVLGIAFGILFGGRLIASFIPQINFVLPIGSDGIAFMVFQGMPLPAMAVSQLISTAVLSIIFILAALSRIRRIEL